MYDVTRNQAIGARLAGIALARHGHGPPKWVLIANGTMLRGMCDACGYSVWVQADGQYQGHPTVKDCLKLQERGLGWK